jgi:hypothetical protein
MIPKNLFNFLTDLGAWALIIPLIFITYNFILFIWWWKKMGSVSEVYAYITILFGAGSFTFIISIIGRGIYHLSNPETYDKFIHSWLWGIRTVPVALAILLISIRMTQRVIKSRYYLKHQEKDHRKQLKREGDKNDF